MHRWLVLKNRDHEALYILTKISGSLIKEDFVDTYLDLEDLRATKISGNISAVSEFMKWKYVER